MVRKTQKNEDPGKAAQAMQWLQSFQKGQQQKKEESDDEDEKAQGPAPPREHDLFDDGGAKLRVMREADNQKNFWKPDTQWEVVFDYKLTLPDGTVVEDRSNFHYTVDSGTAEADGLLVGEVAGRCTIDAALRVMNRTTVVQVTCNPVYAFGSKGNAALDIPSHAEVIMELELKDLRKTEDVCQVAGWGEGLVRKAVMKEGQGHLKPDKHDQQCTLRLRKVTAGRNSTVTEVLGEQTLEFTTGCGEVCDALECSVVSMKESEVADIIVTAPDMWELGNPEGLPSVGPLRFHVELLKIGEAKPRPTSLEEAFDRAAASKVVGSNLFRSQRIRLAKDRYHHVLESLPPSEHIKLRMHECEDFGKRVQEVRTLSELNLAAVALKEDDFSSVISHCSSVLEHESNNIKALFRRAQAFSALEEYDKAIKDCRRAVDIDRSNREVRELLQRVLQKNKSEEQEAKQKHKGFFKGVMKSMGTLGGAERTEEYRQKKLKEWADKEMAKARRNGDLDSSDDEGDFDPEGENKDDPRKFLEDEVHQAPEEKEGQSVTLIPPKQVVDLDDAKVLEESKKLNSESSGGYPSR